LANAPAGRNVNESNGTPNALLRTNCAQKQKPADIAAGFREFRAF
jgi:hypothetical protein